MREKGTEKVVIYIRIIKSLLCYATKDVKQSSPTKQWIKEYKPLFTIFYERKRKRNSYKSVQWIKANRSIRVKRIAVYSIHCTDSFYAFLCGCINSKIRNQYPSIRAEKKSASGNRLNKYESEKTVDRSGSSSYPLQSYLHILWHFHRW